MYQLLNHFFVDNGVFWVALAMFCFWFKKVLNPFLRSHIRNNHEESLDNAAMCIVNNLSKITSASPTDRAAEAVTEMLSFASNRKIPFSESKARGYLRHAKLNFFFKGGHIARSNANDLSPTEIQRIKASQHAVEQQNEASMAVSKSNSANEIESLQNKVDSLKKMNNK